MAYSTPESPDHMTAAADMIRKHIGTIRPIFHLTTKVSDEGFIDLMSTSSPCKCTASRRFGTVNLFSSDNTVTVFIITLPEFRNLKNIVWSLDLYNLMRLP